jgi:hypothetical protein
MVEQVNEPSNQSISGSCIMGSLPSLLPLPMVASDGFMPTTGDQQEGQTGDDETRTAFTGMTGQYNYVLDVQDMEVLTFP